MLKAVQRAFRGATAASGIYAMPQPKPKNNSTDPIEICNQIQEAFEAFQAANDETIVNIQNRFDDVVSQEKVGRIEETIGELKSALDKSMKDIARLTAGGAANDNTESLRANAAKLFSISQRARVRAEDVDVDQYRAYVDAFDQFIRAGAVIDNVPQDVRAAMSVGSDRDGGFLVPTEMSTEMERRIFETSPMRQLARVVSISRGAWEAPFKSTDAVSGGWVGERQARPATGTPELGTQRIETHEQYAFPEVTQEMLDDAAIDVESFLTEETEDTMSRTENLAFVSGNGVRKPRGFLDYASTATAADDKNRDWGLLQFVPTGAAGGFPTISGIPGASDADSLIELMSKLNPAYRDGAVFGMNRSTEAVVRKLKDGDGRYLVGFGDLRDNTFGFSLLGTPIWNLEDMPDVGADSFSITYGNYRRGYLIVDRIGFRVLIDPFTNKPFVGFYITKRTGGDVRNFDAIKLLKFGTS